MPRIWGTLQQQTLEASLGKRRALVPQRHALQTEQRALHAHLAESLPSPDADLWMSVPHVAVTLGARLQAGLGPDWDWFERAEAVQAVAGP